MLSDIEVFLQVVDSNSFYKAANLLKISPASVTRKVANLERELGVTLLNRNTRRFSLTKYGEHCYTHCQNIPTILAELKGDIADKIKEPSGLLNLSVSVYSGYIELLPIVAKFLKAYPQITIQFIKSNIFPDLIDDSYDIYFRYKEINTRTLQSKKLIEHQMICCATPNYLECHGIPIKPDELKNHNCIIHQINLYEGDNWFFRQHDKNYSVSVNGNLRLNNSALVLEAVLQGVGIAFLPSYFFQKFIDLGELTEVLTDFRPTPMPVWLVHPRPKYLSRKHRVFIDFILDAYHDNAS
ncbi:LysR family transcriptional regulator [Legionella steigerwaltii]|uniref:LysR family transcriptional regulator n=1 Tax=Legionella steigerwaltii TaxID=460 RepID=A0A378LC59_9GAMM|nr:LysR family transcriptional regulator [Legionella steigerwaltii]KTD77807.1 LysR family transcriptional regulator [Legionella steigerwaltii]STY24446.1 LysR family transcriptional regulator [Legionella steigerwaltii]